MALCATLGCRRHAGGISIIRAAGLALGLFHVLVQLLKIAFLGTSHIAFGHALELFPFLANFGRFARVDTRIGGGLCHGGKQVGKLLYHHAGGRRQSLRIGGTIVCLSVADKKTADILTEPIDNPFVLGGLV